MKLIFGSLATICILCSWLAFSSFTVRASDLDLTVNKADRLEIQLTISVDMTRVGIQEGNVTRLFVLSEAYDGLPFPPSFQVREITASGTSTPVQTKQVYESYVQGIFASFRSFEGFEFYFEGLPSSQSNSTVLISAKIEVSNNLGFFLRLTSVARLSLQNYPFDQYTFGLGLLVFNKGSNASVSFSFPDSAFYTSSTPLVPTSEDRYVSFRLTGYGRLDPWNLDSERVSEFATPNMIIVRNEFERTFVPMLLMVSFLLLILIMIFCVRNMTKEVVTVFLSLVVLDIGIFEKLGRVEWLVWTPSMFAVLDLFTGAALMIFAGLLAHKNTNVDSGLAEKQGRISAGDLVRSGIVGFLIFWRIALGSAYDQFEYFRFAFQENKYLSFGVPIVMIAVLIALVYVIGSALRKNQKSVAALLERLLRPLKKKRNDKEVVVH